MPETIPGGAFKLPDGRWINAQGKPIPAPNEDEVYKRPEVEEPLLTPPALGPEDDYSKPESMVEPPKTVRRPRKS